MQKGIDISTANYQNGNLHLPIKTMAKYSLGTKTITKIF